MHKAEDDVSQTNNKHKTATVVGKALAELIHKAEDKVNQLITNKTATMVEKFLAELMHKAETE